MTVPKESPPDLSPAHLHALFDILTHHQTYQEIQSFRHPETIYSYGFPFTQRLADGEDVEGDRRNDGRPSPIYADKSDTPILQMMLSKIVLSLPPAKALPADFWHIRIQELMAHLGEAELSESYDQGAMGTRKILATASSSLLESVSRGILGGYPSGGSAAGAHSIEPGRAYDTTDAQEFARAWDDVLRAMVYGTLVSDLFMFCAENENIEEHSSAVRTAVDYIIIQLAEFLHYVFVLSPNGRYLAKLAENTQKLVPYSLIRQTLRVGNAATMINAMMKLLLAKISVGGFTNWMGLTSSAGEGMNLLQRIISMVLSYDASDFKKAAEKIERDRDGPTTAHLEAIREHVARPRQYHEEIRQRSIEQSRSVVVIVLESVDPALADSLSDKQHAQCAQYYASLLSVRDRREITEVFCNQTPDLFTQALREGVSACEPIIRRIHDRIDLKEHLGDFEGFLDELIEVCKSQKKTNVSIRFVGDDTGLGSSLPTVKDFTDLLRRNRHLLYKWLHRVAKETPDIRDTFQGWAVEAVKLFRNPNVAVNSNGRDKSGKHKQHARRPWPDGGSGAMNADLQALFSALPAETREAMVPLIDAHAVYIDALDDVAIKRRQRLIDMINGTGGTDGSNTKGTSDRDGKADSPSRFLARWQALLDDTLIGPATPTGPVRRGRDVANITAPGKMAVGGNGSRLGGIRSGRASAKSSRHPSPTRSVLTNPGAAEAPKPPDVQPVFEALGPQFKVLLQDTYCK